MTRRLKFIALMTLSILSACRSDPIAFHTLTPTDVARHAVGSEIDIESVSVPPQVDRAQIVIRQGASGLAILETQWWGASLADELRSALAEQLYSADSARRTSVRIIVQRFDSVPGQYALIDAKWRLRGGGATLNCRTVLQTPAGAAIDDVVSAHQGNIKELARQINQAARVSPWACPGAGAKAAR
ncbi:putative lipoprotein YmbA [Pseudomonas hunanensis]|uniref:Lipoprotein YmbA n=1 Tax=Pseudomonas hunanensis TaxID=1247546 RepID=A0ACC6K349_9PSED|nr:PqiC family protein [Pseudomonas hunanensis]MDR6712857.1 putative lipoprotein YmbA [Pseudomonas hunanensis]